MEAYQNILCATDFSTYAHTAALRATELAKLYGAKLTLLHVVEYFPEDRSNIQIAPENVDPAAYREEQARDLLAELSRSLDCKEAGQEVLISPHSAKHEIIRFAEEVNSDLIVVASHGWHGIGVLLGSTANGLTNSAPCDVLVVRASG